MVRRMYEMSHRHDLLLRAKIADWIKILTALNEGLGSQTIRDLIEQMKKEDDDK